MHVLTIVVLLIVAANPGRAADTAALARLRQGIQQLEERQISPKQFEEQLPRSNVSNWQRLQRQIGATRSGAGDLAFVLAYYNVDRARNVDRLLQSHRRWLRPRPRALRDDQEPTRLERHDGAIVGTIARDLQILYLKFRDTSLLRTLVSLQLDGGPAEEQTDILQELWPEDRIRMLRVAAGSTAAVENLADIFLMMDDDTERGRKDLAEGRSEIAALTRHPDHRVAQAARGVLAQLHRR
jgi:hypothetical protein